MYLYFIFCIAGILPGPGVSFLFPRIYPMCSGVAAFKRVGVVFAYYRRAGARFFSPLHFLRDTFIYTCGAGGMGSNLRITYASIIWNRHSILGAWRERERERACRLVAIQTEGRFLQ